MCPIFQKQCGWSHEKNVVDPFSSLIVAATFGLDKSNELSKAQQINSASTGVSIAVGRFHQKILGSVEGFKNHDAGYDLECRNKQIIAEVKNKHNTMNSSNRRQVEEDLATAMRQKQGDWTAYLVIIVPSSPERYKKELSRQVYEIDGASFYELATGSDTALHDLYYAVEDLTIQHQPDALADDVLEYCKEVLKKGIPK